MKTGEVREGGRGGEEIKRNMQKRCEVLSKAMGTEAMERV